MPRRMSKGSGPRPSAGSQTMTARKNKITITDAEIDNISIASLTLDTPLRPFNPKKTVKPKPFLFLTMPAELRVRIYEYYFEDAEEVLDLAPENYKRFHKRLGIIRTCKQIHDEITHYFYSTHAVRIFPTYPGKYFKAKKPFLARLKPNQRQVLQTLELRLGPGWDAPPRGWVVNDALGLEDCVSVRKLTVYVEVDPSDSIFKGFRRTENFYGGFCKDLLRNVLEALPNVDTIEFDARRSVKKTGYMMSGLLEVAATLKYAIAWGPERGWTDSLEEDEKHDASAEARKLMDEKIIAEYAAHGLMGLA